MKRVLIKVGVFIISLYLVQVLFLGVFIQYGQSMYPSLKDGDLVFYSRLYEEIYIDDVIVYKQDNELYCGRCLGDEGDEVNVEEGILVVNGINKCYVEDSDFKEVVMEEDHYLVVVDYEDNQLLKIIEGQDIVGKVSIIIRHRGI